MTAVERERRIDRRTPFVGQAFLDRDGVIEQLKIKDFSDAGLGVYATRECPPGQQGMLAIKLARDRVKRYLSQVVWCKPNTSETESQYPYCIGLKIFL